jgi:hypothetical protein
MPQPLSMEWFAFCALPSRFYTINQEVKVFRRLLARALLILRLRLRVNPKIKRRKNVFKQIPKIPVMYFSLVIREEDGCD